MVKIVLPKKIVAKPVKGKNSSKKTDSSSKILTHYQRKIESNTRKTNSSKGKLVCQSNKQHEEHRESSSMANPLLENLCNISDDMVEYV